MFSIGLYVSTISTMNNSNCSFSIRNEKVFQKQKEIDSIFCEEIDYFLDTFVSWNIRAKI